MTKTAKKRVLVLLLVLCAAAGVGGCLFDAYRDYRRVSQQVFGPGRTMEETARHLIHNTKFGMGAKEKAIQHGDAILPLLQKESEDFSCLNQRNSPWIADVLGEIRTDSSRAMLTDLYSRTDAFACSIGAIGLAQHGVCPGPVDEDSPLVKAIRADSIQAETELAIIALGWTKDQKALPCLLDQLKHPVRRHRYPKQTCVALARIGCPDAIPTLRECLADEVFSDLPIAFRTLIALGDRQAVPLAIARVSPDIRDTYSGLVVRELKRITGKSYGFKQSKWQKWWDSVEDEWEIPKKFLTPWDEQEQPS